MTWIEKKAAAALFGTPPTATYEDVVKNLLAAGMCVLVCSLVDIAEVTQR